MDQLFSLMFKISGQLLTDGIKEKIDHMMIDFLHLFMLHPMNTPGESIKVQPSQ